MKNLFLSIAVIIVAVFSLQAQDKSTTEKPKLDVYYFHGTHRCPTCLAIEEQTRKTLDESFKKEMENGIVQLHVLNLEDAENKALVEKFEIGWSSLILYQPGQDKILNLTQDAFATARSQPDAFRKELQEKIKGMIE